MRTSGPSKTSHESRAIKYVTTAATAALHAREKVTISGRARRTTAYKNRATRWSKRISVGIVIKNDQQYGDAAKSIELGNSALVHHLAMQRREFIRVKREGWQS
jgi:hypothetical protein